MLLAHSNQYKKNQEVQEEGSRGSCKAILPALHARYLSIIADLIFTKSYVNAGSHNFPAQMTLKA